MAGMNEARESRPPLSPRHWPGWIAVGLLWLLGKTPRWLALPLCRPLSVLLRRAMVSRRRVAERNLERCFPELVPEERTALLAASFESLARMLFETVWSWSGSRRFLRRITECHGLEEALAAREGGRGLLLFTGHFTCLEIGARVTATVLPGAGGMYRPLRSPVMEWYQNRSRYRYASIMIPKDDLRGAIRFLRRGGMLWYAPDQDFGAERSEFAPFFGIPTATLTATTRLARMTGCRVVPMFPRYDRARRKYVITFFPALENFPGDDEVAALARLNALIEEQVRAAPEQYWWVHRRFKTRPPGDPPFYD